MELIRGTITKVLFKNEENGYAVCKIKIDYSNKDMAKYKDYLYSNTLTITSYYDRIPVEGEELEYTGEFIETKYGIQLKADGFKRLKTDSLESVIAYLSSDYFPGIGKVISERIYKKLGKNCFEKIRKDKDILDEVEGISEVQKDTIYTGLIENKKREKHIVEFIAMGFTMQMAQRIVSALSRDEIKEAKTNPYILIDKVEGIGFLKADKIAFHMGIKKDSPIRLKACTMFYLNMFTYETGNCFISKDLLYNKMLEIFEKDGDEYPRILFEDILISLRNEGKIIIDGEDIYDYFIYEAEGKLATLISTRVVHNYSEIDDKKIKTSIEKVKVINNIEYSIMQERAIYEAFANKIMVITGGPGTGKTTIVKGIIETYKIIYNQNNIVEDVILLAPTGRAGKRLNEVTKHPAQTIHRFLGYDGKSFHHNENNPVNAKLVIIDEMSMVDVILASRLFSALPIDSRIIIVGDVDQIPSVSPGDVLQDIIKSKKIPTIKLDKIHRQAQDSTIIKLAHEMNNGNIPMDILEKQHDRSFTHMIDEDAILKTLVAIVKRSVSQNMNILKDIQILAPMYRGKLGIDNINNIMQEEFNPNQDKGELIHNKQKFRINDKVIQLVNRSEDNIMNGDIGFVESFRFEDDKIVGMIVVFESAVIEYNKDTYEQLKLAYAISIHKSQGSEFYNTIIPFTKKYYVMLKRRLYYTAITRAKKYLIMIGDFEAFRLSVNNTDYSRNTKLIEKINECINSKKSIDLDDPDE